MLDRKEITIDGVSYSLPLLPAGRAFKVMRLCLKATAAQTRALSGVQDSAAQIAAVLEAEADSWWSDEFYSGAIRPLLGDVVVDTGSGPLPLAPLFDVHFAQRGLQHLKQVTDAAIQHNFADFSAVLLGGASTMVEQPQPVTSQDQTGGSGDQ